MTDEQIREAGEQASRNAVANMIANASMTVADQVGAIASLKAELDSVKAKLAASEAECEKLRAPDVQKAE